MEATPTSLILEFDASAEARNSLARRYWEQMQIVYLFQANLAGTNTPVGQLFLELAAKLNTRIPPESVPQVADYRRPALQPASSQA